MKKLVRLAAHTLRGITRVVVLFKGPPFGRASIARRVLPRADKANLPDALEVCFPWPPSLQLGNFSMGGGRSVNRAIVVFGLVLGLGALAFSQAVEMRFFPSEARAVAWFLNKTGKAVTGLKVEFDQPVTLLGKLEVGGGFKVLAGGTNATELVLGGSLVKDGFVELRWQPAAAKPVLVMWLVDGRAAGLPYFGNLSALIKVLSSGLVALREASPQGFSNMLTTFFATNPTLADSLKLLGLTPELLTAMVMASPAEGIENLLLTLAASFKLDTVEAFLKALNWEPIFKALGF